MLLSHMVVSGEKNHGIGDSLEMYINPDKPNKVFHKEQYDMLLMLIYLLVPFELVTFCALAVSRKQMKADQNTCTDNLQD